MRTTNSCESRNKSMNLVLQVMHPSLWTFIERLHTLDIQVENDVIQWEQGHIPYQRKKWVQQEMRKTRIVAGFHFNEKLDYLKRIASILWSIFELAFLLLFNLHLLYWKIVELNLLYWNYMDITYQIKIIVYLRISKHNISHLTDFT